MHFSKYIWQHRIPEWKDYYIKYHPLHKLIQIPRLIFQATGAKFKNLQQIDTSRRCSFLVQQSAALFEECFRDQIKLFGEFLSYKFELRLKRRLIIIVYNLRKLALKEMKAFEKKITRKQIKICLLKYYKELHLFKTYTNLNEQIYQRLIKNYKKLVFKEQMPSVEALEKITETFKGFRIGWLKKRLEQLIELIESAILLNFYKKDSIEKGRIRLAKMAGNAHFTVKEAGQIFFTLGICLMCAVVTILLMIETDFFSEKQSDFIVYQFPIFRGSLVLFIYILFLGVNVYIWDYANINFKRAFDIQFLRVDAYRMIFAAEMFLVIWFFAFLYCGVSNLQISEANHIFFRATAANYIPPFIWLIFMGFLFFPSRKIFYGKGRFFVLKWLEKAFLSPFRDFSKDSLLTIFVVDQLSSFITTLKDFFYSGCYFINVFSTGSMQNTCSEFPFKTAIIIGALFPLFLKFLTLVNRIFFLFLHRKTNKSFSAELKKMILSTLRVIFAFTVSLLSFFAAQSNSIYIVWVVLSVVSTIVLYFWDLVVEWGFLGNKRLLRDTLAFERTWVYYLAMIANLGLRYSWTLTVSPSLFTSNVAKSVVSTLTAVLETFRRVIWNLFKLENIHAQHIGDFKLMDEEKMPFPVEINMADREVNELVNCLFKIYLNSNLEAKGFGTEFKSFEEKENKLLELISKNEAGFERTLFVSKLTTKEFYFRNENELQKDLENFNKTIEKCEEFLKDTKKKVCEIVKRKQFERIKIKKRRIEYLEMSQVIFMTHAENDSATKFSAISQQNDV